MDSGLQVSAGTSLDRARSPGWARSGFLLLLAAQVLLGLVWLARNIGDVPTYSDSLDYIRGARTLEVDAYRGIAYPLFLAAIDRVVGGEGLEAEGSGSVRPRARRGPRANLGQSFIPRARSAQAIVLQLVQLALVAGSLAFFLRTFVSPLGGPGSHERLRFVLLLLLLTDPLIAHLQLAVLTDGLAFSATLVFCASLVRHLFGQSHRTLFGAVLFLSAFLTSALRVEKSLVLLCSLLGSLALWWLVERRRVASERCLFPARSLQAAGIALAGVLACMAVQRAFRGEGKRMPTDEFVLDQRILFPHLGVVYEELPAEVRSNLSLAEAREHDLGVVQARRIIEKLGNDDPELRRSLVVSAARVVLRERWPWIVGDVLRDVVEHVAAPVSWYGHLGALAYLGGERYGFIIRADYNRWTYLQMSFYHPWTTRLHVVFSGLSLLLCTVLALAHVRHSRAPDAARVERSRRLAWVLVGVFVLVNASVFALTSGLVHPRYAVLAHAALLVLAYRGALGWAAGDRARATT